MMATATPPRRPPIFNLPNQLTTARFFLGLVLFGLIQYHAWIASIVVFAVAAFTDWLDGYLARRLNLGSTLGRNLDPLVDKVVVGGAYIFLLPIADSGLTAWMVTLVIAREMLITGLRSFLENQGVTFGADWLGKLKMGLQCAALFGIFVALQDPRSYSLLCRDILIYAMLAATALSGLQYLWRAFALLKNES
jgi:CDP-diacylglycerol---glycerol-3-phosphate 3-phosphatidyltransferase